VETEQYLRKRIQEDIMTQERLIVIGGNAAGMSAASTARRGREDMKITVFEKGPHTSYAP
jgi:predicted flavoprotein YhiN